MDPMSVAPPAVLLDASTSTTQVQHCSLNLVTASNKDTLPVIPLVDPKDMSYAEFYEKHMLANLPVMFKSSVTSDWACRRDWVTQDHGINFPFLEELYGIKVEHN
jgi:hypothetical protein